MSRDLKRGARVRHVPTGREYIFHSYPSSQDFPGSLYVRDESGASREFRADEMEAIDQAPAKVTPVRLDEIEARLAVDHSMSSAYTKARVFPHLFPIGRDPLPCVYGKRHAECEAHNTWLNIDGERRRQCDCTEDDELVLEYIVANDVPALVAEVRELRADLASSKVARVRQILNEMPDTERCRLCEAGESCSGCLASRIRSVLDGTCYPPPGEEA